MKRRLPSLATVRFVLIAVIFMLLADHFIFGVKPEYAEAPKQTVRIEPPPVMVTPDNGKPFFESDTAPMTGEESEAAIKAPETPLPPEEEKPEKAAPVAPPPVAMLPEKLPGPHVGGRPKIAIIIDDVGMDLKHSHEAIDDLPPTVTLAFLPYAPSTRKLAAQAKGKGHNLIIHVPMEAMDKRLNIGPGGLHEGMSDEAFKAAFEVMLKSFDGYDGINNHMGSRLTQDKDAMNRLMAMLASRHLFFVDSKTINTSVAANEAAANGVRYAQRDVFLDDDESLASVQKYLAHAEVLALRRGYAVAIGHPKGNTLAALKTWIPTLKAKGIELVAVKSLLVTPSASTAVIPASSNGIPAQAGIHGDVVQKPNSKENPMDPRLRGNANKGGDADVKKITPETTEAAPAPSVDLFPDEENIVPKATWPSEEEPAPDSKPVSDPASSEPEIRLDPLPTQSPSP